MNGFIFLKQH